MAGAGKSVAVGDSSNNNSVTVCHTVFIPLSLKALKQQYDKHPVT